MSNLLRLVPSLLLVKEVGYREAEPQTMTTQRVGD